MTKKTKILVILLGLSTMVILYLILTIEEIPQKPAETKSDSAPVGAKPLVDEYKIKAKPIIINYFELVKNNNFTVEQIKEIKDKLLELKVPAEFKDLHINLVMAMVKMENYFEGRKESEKLASIELVTRAAANYDWLNY